MNCDGKFGGPTFVKEQQHLFVAERDILRTVFFASHSMTCEDTVRVCSQWNNI